MKSSLGFLEKITDLSSFIFFSLIFNSTQAEVKKFTEFEKVREFLFEFSIDEMFVIFLFFPRSSSSKWSAISLAPTEFLNLYTNAPPQKIPHIYFLFAFHCIRAIQKYYLFAYKFYFSVIYNILGPHIFFLHRFRRSR